MSIDTASLSLTFGPLTIDHFLSIGRVAGAPDLNHYYDATDPTQAMFAAPQRAVGMQDDWVVLDDGTRIRLGACAMAQCAQLDIDASAVSAAVLVRLTLPKTAGEPMFGTGDAALHADVSGSVREMELRVDQQSASGLNETHVPVPLVLWPREDVGMLVADDRPGAIDFTAAERVTATFALPARGAYRIYLYKAPSPLDLVRRYVQLSGAPLVPPRWAFAPQMWRNEWTNGDELRGDATTMRNLGIPGSVVWIDNPWETAYNTFIFDTDRFADAKQLIADLGAQGYKVIFWSTPYVNAAGKTADDHAEGTNQGYFVTDDGGHVIDYPWSSGPGALVDFSKDAAVAWWRTRIARVVDAGAVGFKLDYGEDLVPDLGGSVVAMELAAGDNGTLHNRYAQLYHQAYLGALPAGEAFLISRAGAWGEQTTNTAIWPGDLEGNFEDHSATKVGGLPSAISRGLSLSVSGYPFYGSDIGGFRGFPTTENLLRWAEYAAYGTIMQLGGGGKSHDPWDTSLFDAGATAIYKTYAQRHMALFPYLYTLALQAGVDGTPVTRPAKFVYDCACDDAMFLLGDALLVAPVIEEGATTRSVVLPPGPWLDRSTGAMITGDGTTAITVAAPLATIPTFQRAGTLVPTFAHEADTLLPATATGVRSYADPQYGDELRVEVAPGDPAALTLHDGTQLSVDGDTLKITAGTEHAVAQFAVPHATVTRVTNDTGMLPQVADVSTCAAPGCWSYANGVAVVRLFAPATAVMH